MTQASDPTTGPSGLRGAVQAHLGSRDVAHVIYGAIVGLAFILALEQHPPAAAAAAGLLLATAVAMGLAELYAEVVSTEARTRRPVPRAEIVTMAQESLAVVFGAGFPIVFFVASALGLFELHTAFVLSRWTGLALICGYAFLAARLAGGGIARSLLHAASLGAVAGVLIALKALLH